MCPIFEQRIQWQYVRTSKTQQLILCYMLDVAESQLNCPMHWVLWWGSPLATARSSTSRGMRDWILRFRLQFSFYPQLAANIGFSSEINPHQGGRERTIFGHGFRWKTPSMAIVSSSKVNILCDGDDAEPNLHFCMSPPFFKCPWWNLAIQPLHRLKMR